MPKSSPKLHKRSSTAKALSPKRTPTRRTPKKPRATPVHKPISKRRDPDEAEDYDETHRVTDGKFKGFLCKKGEKDEIILIKNKRGTPMRQQLQVEISSEDVKELNHLDMLDLVSDERGEGDDALEEYEKGFWDCNKCSNQNSNDEGYCKHLVDGKICNGCPVLKERLTWKGCFTTFTQVRVVLFYFVAVLAPSYATDQFVHHSNIRKDQHLEV